MTRQMIAPPRAAREGNARMPYREFLRMDFGDGTRLEWVNGEVVRMAPLSNENTELQFKEYEKGGVRECWLIDPKRKQADFFRLQDDGRFLPVTIDLDGIFRSEILPGFWLRVKWLWQSPLPGVMPILKELKVV